MATTPPSYFGALNKVSKHLHLLHSQLIEILVVACKEIVKNDETNLRVDIQGAKYLNTITRHIEQMFRFSLKPISWGKTGTVNSLELTCNTAKQYNATPVEKWMFQRALSRFNVVGEDKSLEYKPDIGLSDCEKLVHLRINTSSKLAASAFSKTGFVTISVESVGSLGRRGCFKECRQLTNVDLSNAELTNIPPFTFDGCSSLSIVQFPTTRNFRRINDRAFTNCPELKAAVFDSIVFVHENAFDSGVHLPPRADHAPEVQIGERILRKGTRLFGLYTVSKFISGWKDASYFAQNIQLCLEATAHNEGDEEQWYLHIFETTRNLKLITAPGKFREEIYSKHDDPVGLDNTLEDQEVNLGVLCREKGFDGWYQRVQADNYNAELTGSNYETAILREVLEAGGVKQIASVLVNRTEIADATSAVVANDNSVTIKNGRHSLKTGQTNIIEPRNTASGRVSKRQKRKVIAADTAAFLFARLRF